MSLRAQHAFFPYCASAEHLLTTKRYFCESFYWGSFSCAAVSHRPRHLSLRDIAVQSCRVCALRHVPHSRGVIQRTERKRVPARQRIERLEQLIKHLLFLLPHRRRRSFDAQRLVHLRQSQNNRVVLIKHIIHKERERVVRVPCSRRSCFWHLHSVAGKSPVQRDLFNTVASNRFS